MMTAMDRFELITLRLRAGLKQWELAQRLGISQAALCDLERGRRPVTTELEQRIRKAIHEAQAAKAKR